MARPKKVEAVESTTAAQGFTGVAYSCECSKQHGIFTNFRLVTMFFVNGEIVHTEKSDPHATFEIIDIADVKMHRSVLNLNSRYKDGHAIGLGGEDRDALVNKLQKLNPEALELIKPALGLA